VTFTRDGAGVPDAASFVELPELKPAAMNMDVLAGAGAATGEVAPGVHVRSIQGFNVMVINGRDGLTVAEAPEFARGLEAIPASNAARSGRVALEQSSWIASAFPGKPIRHLVVSHHHGDHYGGLPLLAVSGVTVLASSADAAAAQHALGASHRFAPWPQPASSASSSGIATVESVTDRRVIEDGVRRIEVLSTGENPHSDDNLLMWLPSERILFQGDLFYFDAGAPFPPSGRDTMNRFFAKWLVEHGIQPRLIYGVHNNGAAGVEALTRSR
jgi:glyoxylase-like metal-dependent hydrolase (beta-lactamase superfamily II)